MIAVSCGKQFQEVGFDGPCFVLVPALPVQPRELRTCTHPPVRSIPERHANPIVNGLFESGDGLADFADGFESGCKRRRSVLTLRATGTQHHGRPFADRGQRLLEKHDGGIRAASCELQRTGAARMERLKLCGHHPRRKS